MPSLLAAWGSTLLFLKKKLRRNDEPRPWSHPSNFMYGTYYAAVIIAKATAIAKAMPNVANEKRSSKMTTMNGKNNFLLCIIIRVQ
jgi:hypothetical protein